MSTLRVTGLKQETSTATNISLAVGGGVTVAGISTFYNNTIFTNDVTVSGNISVGGTLTYQDVTDVDSIGIITARSGIEVTGHTETDTLNVSGISTVGSLVVDGNVSSTTQFSGFDGLRIHNNNGSAFGVTADMYFTAGTSTNNRGAAIGVEYNSSTSGNDLYFATNGSSVTSNDTLSERLRITSAGSVGIGTDVVPSNTKLLIAGTNSTNYLGLENITPSNDNAGRWSFILFKGRKSDSTVGTLATINAEHDGTGDDLKGRLVFDVHNGIDTVESMRIDSAGRLSIGYTTDLADTQALLVSPKASFGNIELCAVHDTTNSNNRTVLLHRLGQSQGFRFCGDFIVNSWTGNAYINLHMGVRYNTDAVTVSVINASDIATSTKTNLRVITCVYGSNSYLGIQKVSGGTGTCHINAYVSGNIDLEGNGGIREVNNTSLGSVVEIAKLNY